MNRLVAIESPMSPVASLVASRNSASPGPTASLISCSIEPVGNLRSGSRVNCAGITSAVLTSALVTPFCILASASVPTLVRMSQASTSDASPAAMRVAYSFSGVSPIRTCDTTAPFFCARPVMSSTLQPLLSRCAAMPSSAPIVTTPVPPMPVTRMLYGSALLASVGSGSDEKSAAAALGGLRRVPPSTVTNDGQKPFTQEQSLLHDDWSIARLRPNSVSTGTTDTQLDCTPQSPQPSHTS